MGILAISFSFVGAAIGGVIGGPIGANIGFQLGSILGRVVDPADDIRNEGPRLGDLSVTASTYGTPLPLGYGTIPLPGQLIWSSGKREVESVEEVGGGGGRFGGPSVQQVTYITFPDVA